MESKHATTSVGMWGLAIVMISQLANQVFGIQVTTGEQQVLIDAYGHAVQAYTNVSTVVGAVMAILGRLNAKQPVHFITPFVVGEHGRQTPLAPPVPLDVAQAMVATPPPAKA